MLVSVIGISLNYIGQIEYYARNDHREYKTRGAYDLCHGYLNMVPRPLI
jgi:hypothetical protein